MGILTYDKDGFYLDGKPFQIISGAMHYFRIVPEYWEDRLRKLKACGFNTVETYTCWNLHERREGEFDFEGILDIERFIETAEKLDLNIIIRPGPYICAEWEFGGLPSWLLRYPEMGIRCNDPLYLSKVRPYYRELLSRIRPHLSTNGGKVMMVQVENEYGSYGNDKEYLLEIERIYRENGIDCLLFTADGSVQWTLSGGTLPHILSVINFGGRAQKRFASLREFKQGEPLMCGEFWSGWFDHWGEEHHVRTTEDIVNNTRELFDCGASFNFYMFHGGTNFGFWNGANCTNTEYQPTVTSYDYCAPLSEAGDLTPNYYAIKALIEEYIGQPAPTLEVSNTPKAAYGTLALTEGASLLDNLKSLSEPIHSAWPKTMEALGQDFGYVLYSTTLRGPFEPLKLVLTQIHDRAIVFLNGEPLGIQERTGRMDEITISLEKGETASLDILVENMGRVNYGAYLFDQKGILGGIRLGQQFQFGWDMYCLPMEDLSKLCWGDAVISRKPQFLRGTLYLENEPADTFLRLDGFTKGFCLINGFNLGRYFNPAGPQKTLYVPAPILKKGANEVIVFESDGCAELTVEFVDTPQLG